MSEVKYLLLGEGHFVLPMHVEIPSHRLSLQGSPSKVSGSILLYETQLTISSRSASESLIVRLRRGEPFLSVSAIADVPRRAIPRAPMLRPVGRSEF